MPPAKTAERRSDSGRLIGNGLPLRSPFDGQAEISLEHAVHELHEGADPLLDLDGYLTQDVQILNIVRIELSDDSAADERRDDVVCEQKPRFADRLADDLPAVFAKGSEDLLHCPFTALPFPDLEFRVVEAGFAADTFDDLLVLGVALKALAMVLADVLRERGNELRDLGDF